MSVDSASRVAVVGRACRFPGADDVDSYWRNLRAGVSSVLPRSDAELRAAGVAERDLAQPSYVRVAATLNDVAGFDAGFFGMSPRDAAIMDPQHRHFLEVSWEALEDAGYAGDAAQELAVGVFAGCGPGLYLHHNVLANRALMEDVGFFLVRHTGNDKDFLTTRVSYEFDLKGPSVAVQTACSTSLVAIHLACQSLLAGECDVALAGGVTIEVPHGHGYHYRENEILAPDGRCRAFDADAAGTVFGSGAGVVVLRRLDDALDDGDTVHAVVLGSAVNNDGSLKAGYLAPSVEGQAEAVSEALAVADVSADTIGYVEAHGTGTPIGDPIEVAALSEAFRRSTDARGFCRIGSAKPSIGHLDTAAGVAGFIKAVEALRHRELPPSLNFSAPNPTIEFAKTPFLVNDALRAWSTADVPRRAAVNSLGVGGTNAHAVLEEAPEPDALPTREGWHLLPVSARTTTAADRAALRLADALQGGESASDSLADVAFTLQEGRKAFRHRRVAVCRTAAGARATLERRPVSAAPGAEAAPVAAPLVQGECAPGERDVVFVLPGAGGQRRGMAAVAYRRFPVFRDAVDEALALAPAELRPELRGYLLGAHGEDRGREGPAPFVAIYVYQLAMGRLLASLGVEPAALVGHSLGEYAAACLAGSLAPADAMRLVCLRADIFGRVSDGVGMLAVAASEAEVGRRLPASLDLALVNGPQACVVAGRTEDLGTFAAELTAAGIESRPLRVPTAAHSSLLDPYLEEFRAGVTGVAMQPPAVPLASGLVGGWLSAADAADPDYWVRHLRRTVRFAPALAAVAAAGPRLFVELGPGSGLTGLVRGQVEASHGAVAVAPTAGAAVDDEAALLAGLARLWCNGVELDWAPLRQGERHRRVSLPTYPFEHRRHWVEPDAVRPARDVPSEREAGAVDDRDSGAARRAEDIARWLYRPVWRKAPASARPGAVSTHPVLLLTGGPMGSALLRRLVDGGRRTVAVELPAGKGDGVGVDVDWGTIVAGLGSDAREVDVVHAWCAETDASSSHRAQVEHVVRHGLTALRDLLGALDGAGKRASLLVLTKGAAAPERSEAGGTARAPVVDPAGALLHGFCAVIPRELPNVRVRCVDVAGDVEQEWGVRAVVAELLGLGGAGEGAPNEPLVALRDGARWRPDLEPTPLAGGAAISDVPPSGEGTVLITGGLGGLGLVAAAHFAGRPGARLALLGRGGEVGDPRERARRERAVAALRRMGAQVHLVAADVADVGELKRALGEIHERLGLVTTVVHAAGVLADGPLLGRGPGDSARVLAPKVQGALALAEAFEGLASGEPLPRELHFSSTSARLGLAGQSDYAAANAFLDAWARRGGTHGRSLALAWGAWDGVGMAARFGAGSDPLLGARDDGAALSGHVRALSVGREWALDEHRFVRSQALGSGDPVMPGTALLERACLAARTVDRGASEAGAVALADVTLIRPLAVPDGAMSWLRTEVRDEGRDGLAVRLLTGGGAAAAPAAGADSSDGVPHLRARIVAAPARPDPLALAALERRLGEPVWRKESSPAVAQRPWTRQGEHLRFGARWDNLLDVRRGDGEVLATLALPTASSFDLVDHELHPALADIALHVGLPLLPDEDHDGGALYVPLAAGRVRWFAPLTAELRSWVRLVPSEGTRTVRFDVTLTDPDGAVLLELDSFTLRRVPAGGAVAGTRGAAGETALEPGRERADSAAPGGDLARSLSEGIRPREGAEALRRLLALEGGWGGALLSPFDPRDLMYELAAPQRKAAADRAPNGQVADGSAPQTPVERDLAKIWCDLLGLEVVGTDDDFFELGGQSLVAVRLFARIRERWGLDLPLATLFEAPTIAACARLIERERGDDVAICGTDGIAPGGAEGDGEPTRGVWGRFSSLVPIQPAGAGRPFFCAAGMGGTTLNLRRLAKLAGDARPFFGLQPRGLDGQEPQDGTVAEMAAHYLAEVRQVQPHGPYLVGGYSGGGIVAFEMARQLEAAGEHVELLVFLDSFSPLLPRRSKLGRARIHAERTLQQGPHYLLETLGRRYRYQRSELLRRLARPLSKLKPYEYRYKAAEDRWLSAADDYAPGGSVEARGVLFRAALETSLSTWTNFVVDEAHGWRRYLSAVDVRVVPGDHSTMCEEPHVQELAAALRGVLDQAAPNAIAKRSGV